MLVGDLTADPTAQSFIALVDADAYLAPEQIGAWDSADQAQREAALVRASRWLAATYDFHDLTGGRLIRLGHVAARIAAETISRPLFAGTDTGKVLKRAKAGSAEVEYASGVHADAAGLSWPWLAPMLRGLLASGATSYLARA